MNVRQQMLVLGATAFLASPALAVDWHAWGVHGADVDDTTTPGEIVGGYFDTDGLDPDYHWNKSSWETRTGAKAFYSTSDFNGQTVGSITDVTYDVVSGSDDNVYINVVVQDANGKKAIIAPHSYNATHSGWFDDTIAVFDADANLYSIFEAEAGWTGTAATGAGSVSWNQIKDLVIANGPFAEFPDTLAGEATAQGDILYQLDNWADWASATGEAGAHLDGFLITFGQSTGTNPGNVTITNFNVIPEPASLALLSAGGLLMLKRRRISA